MAVKKTRRKNLEPGKGDQPITNFFPRTKRITASLKRDEELQKIHHHLQVGDQDGFKIDTFPDKGKGIITTKTFRRGEFVCEYAGELLEYTEAKEREKEHESQKLGCYMYFFEFNGKKWCVDATKPDSTVGRLINHSKKSANLKTKVVEYKRLPHLIFIASRDISVGEELLYDYGDRRKEVINSFSWLNF